MSNIELFRDKYATTSLSEIRSLIRQSADFRSELETLYISYYHNRLNKRCTDCWLDAYVALTRTKLETLIEMEDRLFELKAGALLVDKVSGDNSKMATRNNLTDELALYHLRTNPSCISKFAKFPNDWQNIVAGIGVATAEQVAEATETALKADVLSAAEDAAKKAETALKGAKTRLENAKKKGNQATIAKAEKRVNVAEATLAEALAQLEAAKS